MFTNFLGVADKLPVELSVKLVKVRTVDIHEGLLEGVDLRGRCEEKVSIRKQSIK